MVESLAWVALQTSNQAVDSSSVPLTGSVAFVAAVAFAFELAASFHDDFRSFVIYV